MVKKFDIPVVPIFIQRYKGLNFKMKVYDPINFSKTESIENITDQLNKNLESMIFKDPYNWIWTHNRWK